MCPLSMLSVSNIPGLVLRTQLANKRMYEHISFLSVNSGLLQESRVSYQTSLCWSDDCFAYRSAWASNILQ